MTGNPVLGDVDADRKALLVDVGEVAADGVGIFVRDVEVDEVRSPLGHFAVDGAGHHVARRQRFHRVVFVHELLAAGQAQDGPEAAHGLGDEEVGLLAGVVERGGVELDELHVFGDRLGAVAHGDAVARGDDRIGGRGVDVAAAARGDDGEFGQHGLDFVRFEIQDVGPEAGQAAGVARDELAQMVLRQQVDGEAVFEYGDAGCLRTDSMSARSISAPVRSSWWRMRCSVWPPSRFSSKRPSGVLSKRVPPFDQVPNQLRRPAHDQPDGLFVAFARAADQRVADVFLESVGGVGYRADAALRIVGVALVHFALRHDGDVSVGGGFERERKACRAGTDNQKVGFHSFASIKRRKVIKNAR